MSSIGKNIKTFCTYKKMTQDNLAQQLFITRQTVSNYEMGKSRPDVEMLIKIAEVLDTDVNNLIYGTDLPFEQKKKYQKWTVVTIISILLVVLAFYLQHLAAQWGRISFDMLPLAVVDILLIPASFVLLGWTIMQFLQLFLGAKKLKGKKARKLHLVMIALLVAYVLIILPYLIYTITSIIESFSVLMTHVVFEKNTSFQFIPGWDYIAIMLIMNVLRFPYCFLMIGAILCATKKEKHKGDTALRVTE